MTIDLKPYLYTKGTDALLDADYAAASVYGKVRAGKTALFWRFGLHRYAISYTQVCRIFRRVESMHIRACGGGRPFVSQWLVLELPGEKELAIHIIDNDQKKAENLLQALKELHPELPYGKE